MSRAVCRRALTGRARFVRVAALLVTLTGSRAAAAEPGFALDRLDAAERGSDWFATESLDLRGQGRLAVGALADYNRNALTVRGATAGDRRSSIVADQLVLHLGGNVTLFDRWRVGLDVPVAAYADGNDATAAGETLARPATTSLGDLRLSSDVRVLGEYRGVFTGALGAQVHLPTGSVRGYTSDGNVRFTPRALVAGRVGPFEWAGRVGYAIRHETRQIDGLGVGSEVIFGASAGVRVLSERLLVGPELFGSSPVGDPDFGARTNALEALLGAHARLGDSVRGHLGGGAGLTHGFGTPSLRTLASLEWTPGAGERRAAPPPRERDTVAVAPAPVVMPEPPPDVAPPPPAPLPPAPPPDRDGDSIADASDACPDDAGMENEDPSKHGCPRAVLRGSRIDITEQIKFRVNSAELDPAGDPVLDAVLEVLNAHPEVSLVRVEGHTDDRGRRSANLRLSKARAAAVAKWLVGHGVAASRLTSQGFGSSQPLVANDSDEGRRHNRRVELHVVEGRHASR